MNLHFSSQNSALCHIVLWILVGLDNLVLQNFVHAKKYYPTYQKTKPQNDNSLPFWNHLQAPPLPQLHSKYPSYTNVKYSSSRRNGTNTETEQVAADAQTTKTPLTRPKPPVGGFSLLFGGVNPNADPATAQEEPPPFGLAQTALTLVPQVKYKVHRLPEWFEANVQFSFPITMFFEKLDFPEGSPPFPFGRRFFHTQLFNRQKSSHDDSRGKRSILSLPPAGALRGGERAFLIPRLEKWLRSTGVNGRACLLKTVCEIHENKVSQTYGFLGEMLTLIFSISRSGFSESHLPQYLKAEEMGKTGNCSFYSTRCSNSAFGFGNEQSCEIGSEECGTSDYADFA